MSLKYQKIAECGRENVVKLKKDTVQVPGRTWLGSLLFWRRPRVAALDVTLLKALILKSRLFEATSHHIALEGHLDRQSHSNCDGWLAGGLASAGVLGSEIIFRRAKTLYRRQRKQPIFSS